VVMAAKYFTKWIEVKLLVKILAVSGTQNIFLAKHNLPLRVPRKVTVDNTKKFYCPIFKDFCHQMGIKAAFASVYHPQSNSAVEKENTLIFSVIKKILEIQTKGKWAEES
jgi:IS30 family transposase